MKKQIKFIMVIMAVMLAAFSISAAAAEQGIKLVLNSENAKSVTSVKFGLKVSGVSKDAEVEVDFSDELPKKMIQKSTYKDGVLNIYLAGTKELFGAGNTLTIGNIEVKNDAEGAKRYQTELIADSVEIINGAGEPVDYAEGQLSISGGSATDTEEPDPEEPDPEEPDTSTEEIEKEKLEGLLAELDKLLSSEYTDESWNALYKMMEQAREMLKNGASKEELSSMYTALLEARKGLVKDEGGQNSGNSQGSQNNSENVRRGAAQTGDTMNVAFWGILGIAAVSGAAVAVVSKKRKK